MLKVGITGGIGSGKSIVCRILEVLGIPVFYSDQEGRELLNSPEVLEQVAKAFGTTVLSTGAVDRKKLADLVFGDELALKKLEAIIHPAVRQRFLAWTEEQHNVPFVAQEAAVMIESGGHEFVDHLVVVQAPEATRIARVIQRDGVEEEQVQARMAAQLSDAERSGYANTIIENDGVQLVIPQVLKLYRELA